MSSIQASLGIGLFDFTTVDALETACFCHQAHSIERKQVLQAAVVTCLDEINLNSPVQVVPRKGVWWFPDPIVYTGLKLVTSRLRQSGDQFSLECVRKTDSQSEGYQAVFFTSPQFQRSFGLVVLAKALRRDGLRLSNVQRLRPIPKRNFCWLDRWLNQSLVYWSRYVMICLVVMRGTRITSRSNHSKRSSSQRKTFALKKLDPMTSTLFNAPT